MYGARRYASRLMQLFIIYFLRRQRTAEESYSLKLT